ncbi:tRNA glutamyl-Q(34) synthetase GluQRS [Cyanobium sp. WAJ14-Wanaka]|uniref:tRNA glutamyl-Q(34) synthetase GluQRS n=1 Tax=Cyanobium sp. WAJ14-Wanaka TaxID=2823725 RepID=UPI0020CCDD0C|nr:tRNA glutamyl-Q(34) synthetase GluQRS [Cyanobium sp. WAJ14-Wanaka]MCP9774015.1 tRNA glutamyl-Q(34) synthetase GluQRS [Cyanobium sp. WAJ14-Wanaka]
MASFLPLLPQHLAEQVSAGLRQREQGYRGRFAPSPTGAMHCGNLRTALLGWLEARLQGGAWLLRIDDLDTPRNRPGASEAIQADLLWLGLAWDGSVLWQSERRGIYGSVLSGLRRQGWLYGCRCSRRMLADISAPHGLGGVYPGSCRELALGWGMEQGRCPSWRLRLPAGALCWQERYGPPGELDGPQAVGDVVLRRADGFLAYHLATAVDELVLGISDVLRGSDLWGATAAQVAVMARLGASPPRYGHLPLWRDGQGQRLSKREGSEGLAGLRAQGLDAPAVVGLLAASAGLVPQGARLSAAELLQELTPSCLDACLRAFSDGAASGAKT